MHVRLYSLLIFDVNPFLRRNIKNTNAATITTATTTPIIMVRLLDDVGEGDGVGEGVRVVAGPNAKMIPTLVTSPPFGLGKS